MNLSAMTLRDLQALGRVIEQLLKAGGILGQLPQKGCESEELLFDLTPGRPVSVLTHWVMPRFVAPLPDITVIEDGLPLSEAAGPAGVRPAAVSPAPAAGLGGDVPVFRSAASAAPEPAPAKRAAARNFGAATLGPLSEAERVEILAATARGETRTQIAARLNRRVQAVALFLTQQIGRDGIAPGPVAEKPVPVVTAAVAVTESPVPVAVAAPVVAQVQAAPKPVAPAAVQVPSRQREIAAALALVPARRGFDRELDLDIVEGLAKGAKTAELAADLGIDAGGLKARFADLTQCIRNERGALSFSDQSHLIAALRVMVKEARVSAA